MTTDAGHISHHISQVLEDFRAGDLTTEMLAHLLANRRAKETFGPPPALEWEQRPRTIEDKAYKFARWARSIGADEDLIACDLTVKLLGLGYSEDDATEILRDAGVVRQRRTAEARS